MCIMCFRENVCALFVCVFESTPRKQWSERNWGIGRVTLLTSCFGIDSRQMGLAEVKPLGDSSRVFVNRSCNQLELWTENVKGSRESCSHGNMLIWKV